MKNKFLLTYLKALRLQTGLSFKNIYFLLFIFSIALITSLLRDDVFNTLGNYPEILNLILICSIIYSIFLKVNICCRITLLLTKGYSFFKKT